MKMVKIEWLPPFIELVTLIQKFQNKVEKYKLWFESKEV